MEIFSENFKNGWKIIFKYLFEYRKEVIFLSILGIISALANGSVPYILGLFFDSIIGPNLIFIGTNYEMQMWMFLLILFGIIQIIADIVDWINSKKSSKIALNLFAVYNARSSGILLKLPVSFHKNEKIGDIMNQIQRASQSLTIIIERVVLSLAPQFLSTIIGLLIAFTISKILTLILIVGIILYLLTLYKVVSPVIKITEKANNSWNKAFGDSYDAVMNFESVKRFGTEEYETKKIYKNFVNIAAKLWYEVQSMWHNITFLQRIIVTCTRILIFIISVYLIQNNSITIGELIALNGYTMMIFGPFMQLGFQWETVQNGVIMIEKAERILTKPFEEYIPKDVIKLNKIKGDIEFNNVYFSYNNKSKKVLKNINFKIKAGEVIALVGESGVGKSTLIDLISGYYFPNKGELKIDNVRIQQLDLNFLRKNIAVVPQEVVLFNDTIKKNIKYGNFHYSDEKVKEASKKAQADKFINKFPKKYKQIVGERGLKLSVGQKQRIAIARAILRDPKILILDEPTSALDSKIEREITNSLNQLMKGRTTFIVAHRLSTVRKADRILVFKDGKIVEEGKHKDLVKIKDGVYKELYDLHVNLK